ITPFTVRRAASRTPRPCPRPTIWTPCRSSWISRSPRTTWLSRPKPPPSCATPRVACAPPPPPPVPTCPERPPLAPPRPDLPAPNHLAARPVELDQPIASADLAQPREAPAVMRDAQGRLRAAPPTDGPDLPWATAPCPPPPRPARACLS